MPDLSLRDIAELSGATHGNVRALWYRNQLGPRTEAEVGKTQLFAVEDAAKMIVVLKLMQVGFTPTAASSLVFGSDNGGHDGE